MSTRYRLKVPIRAILNKPQGQQVSVILPAGAVLVRAAHSAEKATTLFGMAGVYWEDRHYSVYPNDLLLNEDSGEGER